MKLIITFLSLCCFAHLSAQKYFTKTGFTEFKASVEAFEPVEATNNSTTALLNVDNGEIAALLFIKAFNFRVALMQEHFNENYMDSDQFPKATFKGRLENFQWSSLSSTESFPLQGELNIRGKSKTIATKARLTKKADKLLLESDFTVSPQDFDIDIPSIVREKISETITISLRYELIEKK